ncbi:MAG: DUF4300 family protein [Peptostreptococcaceae bacterium]|nr:DUF4300 family protein [Peptostreptococcaceae bacterium]
MNKKFLLVVTCIIGMILVGCTKEESKGPEFAKTLTYSNLSDKASQEEVREAFRKAEISEADIDDFFAHVNEFNETVERKTLTKDGFETIDTLQPEYDVIAMKDLLESKDPDFVGYNCRITSLGLMKSFIEISDPKADLEGPLFLDIDSIEKKKLFSDEEEKVFRSLFSHIPAEVTKDREVHLRKIKENWEEKGIRFRNSDKISMISVFFNFDDGTDEPVLFIGHVGVLLPMSDGKLLFVEKLSFQEPYQAIKFEDRVQLNDYLMDHYDVEWGQETARPFILENDKLIEGYRLNPNNPESNNDR